MIVHVYKEVDTIEVYLVGGGSVLFKDENLADKPQVILKKYDRDFKI